MVAEAKTSGRAAPIFSTKIAKEDLKTIDRGLKIFYNYVQP
jgi:hypothetical protein